MVDSTGGIGPITSIATGNRTQNSQSDKRTEDTRGGGPIDEVEISQAALDASDVAQAERLAHSVGAELAQDGGVSLSGSNFDGLV